jgi:hypothetical protein
MHAGELLSKVHDDLEVIFVRLLCLSLFELIDLHRGHPSLQMNVEILEIMKSILPEIVEIAIGRDERNKKICQVKGGIEIFGEERERV